MLFKVVQLLVLVCAVSAQILPPTGFRRVRPGPIVNTKLGPIQGQEETYDILRRIHTYKGIRYAKAPVGDLRFRQPVPAEPFLLVHQAFHEGAICPQLSFFLNRIQGDEDCLFLNIAAPTNIRSRLPVVVSIHGGGLQYGSGSIETLGPEYLNQEGVIFVSVNYRLNVFGFLNVGDKNAPGNFGLKDILEALRWVQDNIEYFGGNPDDVTIWGISGGAVAVHALVISPTGRGLFHKAISHSGSLFSTWAFNRNPVARAQMLARNLQLNAVDNTELVRQLREVSMERMLQAADLRLSDLQNPGLFNELSFMPSVDPVDSEEPIIFTAPPAIQARFGSINNVPYMIGFNYMESAATAVAIRDDPTILERFNQNPYLLIPTEWNLLPDSTEAQEVLTQFRRIYFNGRENITTEDLLGWLDYVSDREFVFGVSKQVRIHRNRQPVHYFRFGYSGSLSLTQRLFGLSELPGAIHGDDMFYIFRMNVGVTPVLPGDEAFRIQRRQVRLWSNFMKYSEPTPTNRDLLLEGEMWHPTTDGFDFMEIDRFLRPGTSSFPFTQRMSIWHMFDERFAI